MLYAEKAYDCMLCVIHNLFHRDVPILPSYIYCIRSFGDSTVDLLLQKRARVTQYVLLYAKLDDLGPNPEACDVFGELAEYLALPV